MVSKLKTCTHLSTSAQNIKEMEMKKRTSNIEWTSHKLYTTTYSNYGRTEYCLYQRSFGFTSHVSAQPSPMHLKRGLSQTKYFAESTDSTAYVSTTSPTKSTETLQQNLWYYYLLLIPCHSMRYLSDHLRMPPSHLVKRTSLAYIDGASLKVR